MRAGEYRCDCGRSVSDLRDGEEGKTLGGGCGGICGTSGAGGKDCRVYGKKVESSEARCELAATEYRCSFISGATAWPF